MVIIIVLMEIIGDKLKEKDMRKTISKRKIIEAYESQDVLTFYGIDGKRWKDDPLSRLTYIVRDIKYNNPHLTKKDVIDLACDWLGRKWEELPNPNSENANNKKY